MGRTLEKLDRVILKGGTVKLEPSAKLANAVEFEEEKAAKVEHRAEAREAILEGYEGTLRIPEKTPIQIVVENARIAGQMGAGRLLAGGIDLTIRPGPAQELPRTRLQRLFWVLKDVVGITGATVIFCMIFLSINLDCQKYLVWEIVLGAGAYFGFSGRWLASVIAAGAAIVTSIVWPEAGLKQWQVFANALIKVAVFMAIMGVGKWLRDYLDQYVRGGYTGLKNSVR